MEQPIAIPCGDIRLEGRFEHSGGKNGVVVAHPHPLYGGDLQNPVVAAVTRTYARMGYSTLRFNFRGTGKSGGAFDEGRGEQLDILACIDFLQGAGVKVTDLAGYSFGAWVLAKLSPPPEETRRVLMVAPPVAFMDFSGVTPPPPAVQAIAGSHDAFAPPDEVENWLASGAAAYGLTSLQGADHFFTGRLSELENAVSRAICPQSS